MLVPPIRLRSGILNLQTCSVRRTRRHDEVLSEGYRRKSDWACGRGHFRGSSTRGFQVSAQAGAWAETGANMPRDEDARLLTIMRNREPQKCTAALRGGPISAFSFHVI